MNKKETLNIKGTFEDVMSVAGKYTPKTKAAKPGRKKAAKKPKPSK